jgi:hypothetical protein
MVPSTGRLPAWVRPIGMHEPSNDEIKDLKDFVDRTIKTGHDKILPDD